jgi:hypothetical protein
MNAMRELEPYKVHRCRKTTLGHIDSASITHVVQALDVYPKLSEPKGWDTPLLVTSLLIATRNIGLSPGISKQKILSEGPIGNVTRKLLSSGVMAMRNPTLSKRQQAIEMTKEQIHTYPSEYRRKFENLLKDDSAIGWLQWSRRRASVEHFQNLGTLVDQKFIPEMAIILNIGENELKKLHKETSRPQVVEGLSEEEKTTDLCSMVFRCFLLDTLLRGMYHDHVADTSRRQVAHHPIREPFLANLHTQPVPFPISTVSYLASIILHEALVGKKLDDRLLRWVENIAKVRRANQPGNEIIDLRPKEDPTLALEKAFEAAKKLDICVVPSRFEAFMPKVFAVGVRKVVEILLTPYNIGISATIGAEVIEVRAEHLARSAVRKLYGRRGRLTQFAKSPPGRLSIWKRITPI